MEFKFRYTAAEILDYGVNMVWRAVKAFWKFWLVLVVFLLVTSDIRWREVFLLKREMLLRIVGVVGSSLLWSGGFLALFFLTAIYLMGRRFRGTDLEIAVKDGSFITVVGESRWQYSCDEIVKVEKRGRFIAFEMKINGMRKEIFLLPRRMFAGAAEQRQFLEFVERQGTYSRELSELGWKEGTKRQDSVENENESAAFDFETAWNEQMISEVKAEVTWIGGQPGFSTESYRLLMLIIGVMLMVKAAGNLISGKGGVLSILLTGMICMVILWFAAHRKASGKPGEGIFGKIQRSAVKKDHGREEALLSRTTVGRENILVREGKCEAAVAWRDMSYLLESGPWFLIYNKKKRPVLHFPKENLGDVEEQKRFVQYCREHGLEYRNMRPERTAGKAGKKSRSCGEMSALAIGLFLLICIVTSFVLAVLRAGFGAQVSAGSSEEETTEYVFHPEEFEDYLPLEKQVGVLRSLGIKVPEKLLEEEREWMAEYPGSREWIEGEPFYTLLSDLGYPEYDEETYEIKTYSSQMYTLDWEIYDLTEDYTSLLNGVRAISRGEFALTSPAVILDGADAESMTGTVQIYFLLNGTPYLYDLEVDDYYLDTAVLGCMNAALGKENVAGRLYGMDYDGWSCVLFYKDREWAAEFTGKTGIPLVLEYAEE